MGWGWWQKPWLIGSIVGTLLLLPAGAAAQRGGPSLEQRLERLERLMSSSAMMDLMEGVQRLQSELQELRGEVEQQTHIVEQLRQRQRELYLDVDRRLRRMEAGVPGAPPVASSPGAPMPRARVPVPTSPAAARPQAPPPPTSAGTPPVAAVPAVDPVKEQAAYQRAFNLLKEGRYEQAAAAFQAFLSEYQGGHYADNAQYWLGEAYYVTRQFEPALTEFQKLMQNYPASSKVTHAMLKVGYIYDEMDKPDKARETLKGLIANHPKTTAARLAEERLRRMKQEGR